MNFHYVYIIQCGDGTYYTGYTINVMYRLNQHWNGKGAKYTKGRTPLDLVHVETYSTKSEAMRREYQIKQLTKKQKTQLIYGSGKQTKI